MIAKRHASLRSGAKKTRQSNFNYMTAKSKRRFGLFLVVGSVAILLMLLPAYAIVTFVISQILVVNESSNIAVIGQVISFVLGISGVLALVGIPVGAVLMSLWPPRREDQAKLSRPVENGPSSRRLKTDPLW